MIAEYYRGYTGFQKIQKLYQGVWEPTNMRPPASVIN